MRGGGQLRAGGFYQNGGRHSQGFVASERHGRWGKAIEVPGLRTLSNGRNADVFSVSCASAGNCAAGGFYQDRHGHGQGYVVSERNGRWGKAIEVPGLAALNKGGTAVVVSVSCGSAGSRVAGGDYRDRHFNLQGFVAVERRGRWGRAIEVPDLAALNKTGHAEVDSVSCASAGSCAAGGHYANGDGHAQGFVADEDNGRWGTALKVPGLEVLDKGGGATVDSVSCGSAGSCVAGGDYRDRQFNVQGFVAVERNGRWRAAIEVPGLAALNTGRAVDVLSVSCGSAGSCAARGEYADRHNGGQGFVAVGRLSRPGLRGRSGRPGSPAAGRSFHGDLR